MKDQEFQDLIKLALNTMKERTIEEIAQKDISLQDSMRDLEKAGKELNRLKEQLSDEQRQIVDNYLSALDTYSVDYNDITYIVGMKDMLHALKAYGLLKKE